MVDNFEELKRHLSFESEYDRYIVHILKRSKDDVGKTYGVNETNRLIKTIYITSLEYFNRKIPVIKDLCVKNNARAYILPQVRNNEDCLKELLKIVVDNISNPTIKPDHLIRTAYCGYHGSRDKKWICDLDCDNLIEYKEVIGFPNSQIIEKRWTYEEILDFVQKQLEKIGKKRDNAYMIQTKNGKCIITPPFNLNKAYEECSMMYQGLHKIDGVDISGWIIKDGMALLFCP